MHASLKPGGGTGGTRAAITGQHPIQGDDCPVPTPEPHWAAGFAGLRPCGGTGGTRAAITRQHPILGDDCPPLRPNGSDIDATPGGSGSSEIFTAPYGVTLSWEPLVNHVVEAQVLDEDKPAPVWTGNLDDILAQSGYTHACESPPGGQLV
eukprot:gene20838-27670_t